MIPTNQFQSAPYQVDLSQIIPEGQPLQFPKIDHILAHAKNPELSYIYAMPELQASAASELRGELSLSKNDSQTPKKGRPKDRDKKLSGLEEKKTGTKIRKSEIYEKYYLDGSRMKKNISVKKIDLWSKEDWEDILNRKRKYFDFCKLTGELTDLRSDDEEDQEEEEENEEKERERREEKEEDGVQGEEKHESESKARASILEGETDKEEEDESNDEEEETQEREGHRDIIDQNERTMEEEGGENGREEEGNTEI